MLLLINFSLRVLSATRAGRLRAGLWHQGRLRQVDRNANLGKSFQRETRFVISEYLAVMLTLELFISAVHEVFPPRASELTGVSLQLPSWATYLELLNNPEGQGIGTTVYWVVTTSFLIRRCVVVVLVVVIVQ